jgi:hypothetical protein
VALWRETSVERISGTPLSCVLVIAAFLSTVLSAATPVGAGVKFEIKGDNPVQGEGEGVKDRAGLAGCYDLAGVDTQELPYSGTFCIEVLGDLLYELTWTLMEEDEGLVVYTGRGVSMGDDLFAVWRESGTDYDCFLHLFEIDIADGTLNGLQINMSGTTSSQTATRGGSGVPLDWSEAGQLAGSYALEGSDEHTGELLTVTHLPIETDDAYSFRWSGDTGLEGVGVRDGNSIFVVANPIGQMGGTCGSITYAKNKGNRSLEGSYFTLDSLTGKTPRRRGEETATTGE